MKPNNTGKGLVKAQAGGTKNTSKPGNQQAKTRPRKGLEHLEDGKDEDAEGKGGGCPRCPSSCEEEAEGCREGCCEDPAKEGGGSTPCKLALPPLALVCVATKHCLAVLAARTQGAHLLCFWQAKKPVVVEEPDDESEEEEAAPVNGAAAPATPAKVDGPPLLPPAPIAKPRTSCVLGQA